MATTTVDELVTKISQLPRSEREELVRRLNALKTAEAAGLERKTNPPESGVPKQPLHPNTIWIKENGHKYAGQYVALKDGRLIATGRTFKEADLAAKEKGVEKLLFHYVFPEDYVPWGGW